jgi:hypothetical protein
MSDTPRTDEEHRDIMQSLGATHLGFVGLGFARNLERELNEAQKILARLRQDLDDPPADVQEVVLDKLNLRSVITERNEARELARELRDALETVNYIDLSPCNGGSCMVATDADDSLDAIKNRAAPLLAKAKEVLG